MYAHSVQIGPEFFRKAFDDYSDRFWAFVREIMQNSLDCGSTRIAISFRHDDDNNNTVVMVENNGTAMTNEILVNKLLSLGSSGKDFQAGAVGGFGKAKEILYFAHRKYTIVSGDWFVLGSGAGYNLTGHTPTHPGTTSIVTWEGQVADVLRREFRRFVRLCSPGRKVKFEMDGETLRPGLRVGEVQRTLHHEGRDWAEVRLSRSEPGLMVVRIGGIPMFHQRCDYSGTVVLDLAGPSVDTLTSNRDGLKYPYRSQFSDFVTTIAVDRTTAFKLERATYERFAGEKLGNKRASSSPDPDAWVIGTAARSETPMPMGGAGILVRVNGRTETPPSVLRHEFIIKNCVRRAVPEEFRPSSLAFSDHAHWLIRAYAGCLVELHEMFMVDRPFSVGFIFSQDCLAEFEQGDYGAVYYLNPCHVGKRRTTRRFKKANRLQIVAGAAHEFVHGGLNESWHGEDFANKLTEVMALVMRHSRRFTRHLQ